MSSAYDEAPTAVGRFLALISTLGALLLLALGALVLAPAPTNLLWKLSVGVIEWGHILAIVALLFALRPKRKIGVLRTLIALAAVGLFLSPAVRAYRFADPVDEGIDRAFRRADTKALPPAPAFTLGGLLQFSPAAPVSITTRTYKRMADGEVLSLDLYKAGESKDPRPVILMIHGGAWRSGDRTQLDVVNRELAASGYLVAALSYRLAPRHPFPAAREDVLAAVRYLKEEAESLGIDRRKIVLAGRSAGGHLALLCAYEAKDPDIKAVISFYGPTDMVWSWNNPSNPWVINTPEVLGAFLGGGPQEKPDDYRAASPLDLVHPEVPPTLLIHGGKDELVSPRQSERLAEKLEPLGVRHYLLAMPWATHGCDANPYGPSGQISLFAIKRFLEYTL